MGPTFLSPQMLRQTLCLGFFQHIELGYTPSAGILRCHGIKTLTLPSSLPMQSSCRLSNHTCQILCPHTPPRSMVHLLATGSKGYFVVISMFLMTNAVNHLSCGCWLLGLPKSMWSRFFQSGILKGFHCYMQMLL